MRQYKNIKIFIVLLIITSSCIFNQQRKDVHPFYTTQNYGQFPLLPLIKPINILCDDQSKEWDIKIPHSFKNKIGIYNQTDIGVEKTFIYGGLSSQKQTLDKYKISDFVYISLYGGLSVSQMELDYNDIIRIYPIEPTSKIFILPERWFIINIADSTTQAFFSKIEYQKFLKEKGVSGKMYDINASHKQYKETGILPWFPDSVKVKLKK